MAEWDPDFHIDEALVRVLVSDQFPELEVHTLRLVGEGFDNSVWVVDDEWAFRFPRRNLAVPLVARELVVLARVAPLVPVAVPVPAFVGTESELFPRPFFGHRILPGVEAAQMSLMDADRVRLGIEVARFLRALHAPETKEAVDGAGVLPVDPNRRADMPFRAAMARDRLARLTDLAPDVTRAADQILADAAGLAPSANDSIVHGDLHGRHVLVDRGELSGVIDWGDVCVGDPAIDLQLFWSFVPPNARSAVFAEYGAVDDEARLRARVLAIMLSALLTLYARHEGLVSLERESLAGLERTLVD
jgi:aminoglycoside phosphotransferase (APT) family kinase protein